MMKVQGHRVSNQLKSIIQTSIMLTVEQGRSSIGDLTDSFSVVIVLSGTIHFQLHTKVSGTISIEDRLRFVVVAADVFLSVVAIVAVSIVLIFVINKGISIEYSLTAAAAYNSDVIQTIIAVVFAHKLNGFIILQFTVAVVAM